MKIYIILITFFFFLTTVYADESINNEATDQQNNQVQYKLESQSLSSEIKRGLYQYQKNLLTSAFKENSNQKLEIFFQTWSEVSPSINMSNLDMLPPAIKQAYKIFEDFYEPKNLTRIGDSKWRTEQFSHVSYFIIQGSIGIAVTDKLLEDFLISADSFNFYDSLYYIEVEYFKPRIKGNTKALFLDEYHRYILEEFLGKEELPMGSGNIMAPSRAIGDSEKRQKFLNQYVQIYHGHWGGWILPTGPIISYINFNKNFTEAIVHFSIVYQGGTAYYQFRKGKWELRKSRLTWVQ